MKVEIEWTEEVTYRSVVEIDQQEFTEWATKGAESLEDLSVIYDFLEADQDDSAWFEQTNPNADCYAVADRRLVGVTRLVDRDWDESIDGPANDDWISSAYESAAKQPTLTKIIEDDIRFDSGLPGSLDV